jgi:pimeloyl-ACP methyl ester carboxylesterase
VPATTPTPDGDGIMFEDGAHAWMTRVAAERAPTWRNEVRVSALLEPFRPIDHLANAKVPLLLLVAPADSLTPPGPALALAAATPLVELVDIPGGHFAAYESGFAASIEPTIAFLGRHLGQR